MKRSKLSTIPRAAARMLLATLLLTMTVQTAWAADVTLSGSDNYTAQEGDVLTGSTSGTVTIASGANVTLSNATITGGIVCEGTATITLIGTNSVTGKQYIAGIQVGGASTTLTIKGAGSLAATGGAEAPGIGVSCAMNASTTGGDIVFEGGNITATGTGYGTGIGTGVCMNGTATIGNITFKGGTVKAIGGVYYSIIQVGIGKGYILSGGSAVVGTITIYDSIEMVDASSIGESVTYMHDETDVTANPSEYFTIGENGGQRIIVPKDDTEYTITIADGIEHGTLTGAATAKVLEKVTITATPGLGYIFSRLIVKDANNNDVATTGNSFIMPKSNVTVSAVFERGTHGTTSFLWNDSGDLDDMESSNVYDGITTVSLKHGRTYQIADYNNIYFILDNNTLTADIPYSAGTGAFTEYGAQTATKFKLPDSAIEGFYDVTMTDAGNGKWSVSILKTVGQIDVIPDQTYTGSEIKPEPLVLAGSLSLTNGTDYEYSYTDNINVGTAKVTVTFKGNYASIGSVEKEFNIVPKPITVTADNQTKEYGAADPTLTATVEGLIGDDVINYTVSRVEGETVGDYAVTPTGEATQGNYVVTYVPGTMTITPKTMTGNTGITVSIPSQEWTGSELTFDPSAVVVKDGETTLTQNTDYTVTAPSSTIQDAGDYTFTIIGAGNYSGEATATFTITPKTVTNSGIENTGSDATITLTQDQNGTMATLDGASEGSVTIKEDVEVNDVKLGRTFNNGQKTAICWPFEVSAEQAAALGTFYEFKGINTEGKIEMKVVSTDLAANTPYIFEPSGDKVEIDFGAKTLKAGGPASVGSGFTYKGIYSRVRWTTDDTDPLYNAELANELGRAYGFALETKTDLNGLKTYSPGQFVKLGEGAHSRPFRAYMVYDGAWDGNEPTAAARRINSGTSLPKVIDVVWLSANGQATGISTLQQSSDTDAWYSLDGRRLSGKPATKGLYINNGKKVIIK